MTGGDSGSVFPESERMYKRVYTRSLTFEGGLLTFGASTLNTLPRSPLQPPDPCGSACSVRKVLLDGPAAPTRLLFTGVLGGRLGRPVDGEPVLPRDPSGPGVLLSVHRPCCQSHQRQGHIRRVTHLNSPRPPCHNVCVGRRPRRTILRGSLCGQVWTNGPSETEDGPSPPLLHPWATDSVVRP